ncbi:MAG: ribosome silencing factor [Clostridia bacterium]|nr:ribosome silencing factor [Clostridia bacterium]
MDTLKKCEIIIKALDSKKGLDIKLIKVSDITSLTEYFIIAAGSSSTQVKALAEEAEFQLSQQGVEPHHIEGKSTGWILLDYSDVVVHVLNEQARSFYDLERLWADGEQVDISDIIG